MAGQEETMDNDVDLKSASKGFFVRDKQGSFYFMTNEEAKKYAVGKEDLTVVEKMWKLESAKPTPPGGAKPAFSCETLWNWLTHHPIDMAWRKVSVMWMNQC